MTIVNRILIATAASFFAFPAYAVDTCAVTTSAPSYTNGNVAPLSCDTSGNSRVTTGQLPTTVGSKADASSLAVTQSTEDKAALAAMSAKLPATLGSKADASSLAVTQSTEDKAALAAMSAKLPATLGSKADAASLAVTHSTEDKAVQAAIQAAVEAGSTAANQTSQATILSAIQVAIEVLSNLNYTPPATGTLTAVSDDDSPAVDCHASNTSRQGLYIYNDSTATLYVRAASGTATTTAFTQKVDPGGAFNLPLTTSGVYTGAVSCIWSADASGAARVTEW